MANFLRLPYKRLTSAKDARTLAEQTDRNFAELETRFNAKMPTVYGWSTTKSGPQTLSNNTTTTIGSWDSPADDVNNWFDSASGVITPPVGVVGSMVVFATLRFASNATGYRQLSLTKLAPPVSRFGTQLLPAVSGNVSILTASHTVTLDGLGTATYGVTGHQTSGISLAVVDTDGDTRIGILFVGVGLGI